MKEARFFVTRHAKVDYSSLKLSSEGEAWAKNLPGKFNKRFDIILYEDEERDDYNRCFETVKYFKGIKMKYKKGHLAELLKDLKSARMLICFRSEFFGKLFDISKPANELSEFIMDYHHVSVYTMEWKYIKTV